MNKLKYFLALHVFLGIMPLYGCEFKDIDKRLFVMTIGIDSVPDNQERFAVTLKLAIPSPDSKKKQEKFQNITAEGISITSAIRAIKARVGMELEFGQAKAIILGEGLSEKDLLPSTDWLVRNRDIQKISLLAIGKPSAKAVLEVQTKTSRLPAYDLILALSGNGTESNYITNVMLFDFYRKILEKGLNPVLPIVSVAKDEFVINQTAILTKGSSVHTKLMLNPRSTEMNNLVCFSKPHLSIHVQQEELNFDVEVLNIKSRYSIQSSQGKPTALTVTISGNGVIGESKHPLEAGKIRHYEKLAQEKLKERMEQYLKKNSKCRGRSCGLRTEIWIKKLE